mmetsp:Transcript_108940/g.325840  ORF Transcript_108940/g.325840 Transcript_108940/m.325840 type:complete len:251 (+) Transcript_108940:235-987(+)
MVQSGQSSRSAASVAMETFGTPLREIHRKRRARGTASRSISSVRPVQPARLRRSRWAHRCRTSRALSLERSLREARRRSSMYSQCRTKAAGTVWWSCGQPAKSKQRKRLMQSSALATPSAARFSGFRASDSVCRLGFARASVRTPLSEIPGQLHSSTCVSRWPLQNSWMPSSVTPGQNERSNTSSLRSAPRDATKSCVTPGEHLANLSSRSSLSDVTGRKSEISHSLMLRERNPGRARDLTKSELETRAP